MRGVNLLVKVSTTADGPAGCEGLFRGVDGAPYFANGLPIGALNNPSRYEGIDSILTREAIVPPEETCEGHGVIMPTLLRHLAGNDRGHGRDIGEPHELLVWNLCDKGGVEFAFPVVHIAAIMDRGSHDTITATAQDLKNLLLRILIRAMHKRCSGIDFPARDPKEVMRAGVLLASPNQGRAGILPYRVGQDLNGFRAVRIEYSDTGAPRDEADILMLELAGDILEGDILIGPPRALG